MAVVDPSGRLHVVWAESQMPQEDGGAPQQRWQRWRLQSVWYATHLTDEGWDEPRKVYEANRLVWFPRSAGLVVGSSGRVHLAVASAQEGVIPRTVAHLALSPDAAIVREQTVGPVGYTSTAATDSGDVFVAFIGGEEGFREVHVTRSHDGGRTWRQPDLVERSERRTFNDIDMVSAADGLLHVLWGASGNDSSWPQMLLHAASADYGVRWSTPDTLKGAVSGFDSASDACGRLHVVFEEERKDGDRMLYAYWSNRWSMPRSPFPDLLWVDMAVNGGYSSRGDIVVVGSRFIGPIRSAERPNVGWFWARLRTTLDAPGSL